MTNWPKSKADRIGTKIVRREGSYSVPTYEHYCPACGHMHGFAVEKPFHKGDIWTFNGNGDIPTFSPSMNIGIGPYPDGHMTRCHYFLTEGRIQYLNDCTHDLVGQTVECPDIPEKHLLLMGLIP